MGDFNAILNPDDRLKGSMVTKAKTRDFRDFIMDTGLCELKTVGRDFTWTNSNVFSRIDRALVNAEWVTRFTQLEIEAMDPRFSNHSPIYIDFMETINTKPRPFKFLNHLADHPNFVEKKLNMDGKNLLSEIA